MNRNISYSRSNKPEVLCINEKTRFRVVCGSCRSRQSATLKYTGSNRHFRFTSIFFLLAVAERR